MHKTILISLVAIKLQPLAYLFNLYQTDFQIVQAYNKLELEQTMLRILREDKLKSNCCENRLKTQHIL